MANEAIQDYQLSLLPLLTPHPTAAQHPSEFPDPNMLQGRILLRELVFSSQDLALAWHGC